MMSRARRVTALAGPVAITLGLSIAMPYTAGAFAHLVLRVLGVPHPPILTWLYAHHAFQLLLGLLAIALVRHWAPADYGLHGPRGKSYVPEALLWGALFGGLMTLVDYAPQLLAHTVPDLGYPLTVRPVVGWLFFEGVYVGPTEEIPFRALLVTFLAATMPGRLRLGRFDMNWAGVIVAGIFALLHFKSFATRPGPMALGQQLYAFALGILYAYWLEKSRSIVAPIIGHNVGDAVEYALLYLWVGLTR